MQWLFGVFIKALLEKAYQWIANFIAKMQHRKDVISDAKKQSEANTDKLKQVTDETPAEKVDEAIDDALKKF